MIPTRVCRRNFIIALGTVFVLTFGSIFVSASNGGISGVTQVWEGGGFQSQQGGDFETRWLDKKRAGWVKSDTQESKSIGEMGYASQLSEGDDSKNRDDATMHKDWWDSWDFSWFKGWFNWGPFPAGAPVASGLNVVFWIFIILLALVLVGILCWLFIRFYKPDMFKGNPVAAVVKRKPKIEDLPFEMENVQLDEKTLWNLAKEHRQKGELGKSVIFLYSYLLLYFDRIDVLVLRSGKTNRTYLAEIPKSASGRPLFANLMFCFEGSFFGGIPVEERQLDQFFTQCGQLTKAQ